MSAPTEHVVGSLTEFLAVTKTIGSASSTGTLWYRGASDSAHELLPRLYRSTHPAGRLVAVEREMLAQFRARSRPYLDSEIQSPWGYLFLMQHYGVPTRLLDWSENAFVGLYFALSVAESKGFPTDAAVWVLDACSWNAATFPGMPSPGAALHADDSALLNFGPDRDLDQMATGAAAMHAQYNNPRITAQRGVFTVFGRDKQPMEKIFDKDGFDENVLAQLRFPQGSLEKLYAEVRLLGFRESMIYPDLGGLAIEIRTDQGLL
jgi:hypothetical protein